MVPRWCHGKKKALEIGLFNIKRRNRDFIIGFFRISKMLIYCVFYTCIRDRFYSFSGFWCHYGATGSMEKQR